MLLYMEETLYLSHEHHKYNNTLKFKSSNSNVQSTFSRYIKKIFFSIHCLAKKVRSEFKQANLKKVIMKNYAFKNLYMPAPINFFLFATEAALNQQ